MEKPSEQFRTPQEEIAFLREQIASKERELLGRNAEADTADFETLGKQELKEYVSFTPQTVLHKEHQKAPEEASISNQQIEVSLDKVEETVNIALERGIHHALSVIQDRNDAYLADEVHRRLIEYIRNGRSVQGLREGVPPWQVMHMTLFEVTLPNARDREDGGSLLELLGKMEQFFSGMRSIKQTGQHYVLELAVANGSDDIVLFVSIPDEYIDLFEKIVLSLFPGATLIEQQHDYNIFVDGGDHALAVGGLKKHPIYPLRYGDEFQSDPLMMLLNAFSKIEKEGGGAAVQFVIKPAAHSQLDNYHKIIERVEQGMKPKDSIAKSTLGGDMMFAMKDLMIGGKKKDESEQAPHIDTEAIERFRRKIEYQLTEVNMRIAVSASTEARANQILSEIEATFNQYQSVNSNQLTFTRVKGSVLRQQIKAFSFREFLPKQMMVLSELELATLFHFPDGQLGMAPQYKQSYAKTAPAPTDMPTEGTTLGKNVHRGVERGVFVTEKDRMRHFYIIGQTGTGKSVFMQNLIVQDIQQGHGVCMIDPHGTDIQDVLGAIPPEREKDIIYFDPSNLEQVIGLNMLEYDYQKPEQKTFVVNELFSIFQKLYGANPESMGPMFEQYFRNATMLVMDHPESGNTLMDIGRVFADASFRRLKLQHATNPVVKQFWTEIATKAGGEASLENIVPYIVSKFDVFTANDYMRPIIGQQESTFNFRDIMDNRKILLVNLSKGRLGEINSNLIGMIVVGKILMAALSRVDTPSDQLAPFFLHIDEFQNVSTPSISAILSEARKYKLGLAVAHQFIAQLDDGIRDAVFGNVGSMTVFRVGPEDAQFLEKQLDPIFSASEIMNIPNYQAYGRILANGVPTKPFSIVTPPPPESNTARVPELIHNSLATYGRPRAEVEAEISKRYEKPKPPLPKPAPPQM